MSVSYVIHETLLMMGFTALIGFALAYLIKLLIAVFFVDRKALATQYKALSRSRRIEAARIRQRVKTTDGAQEGSLLNYVLEDPNAGTPQEQVKDLDRLASFHYGDRGDTKKGKKDEEMNSLYEYHGKV